MATSESADPPTCRDDGSGTSEAQLEDLVVGLMHSLREHKRVTGHDCWEGRIPSTLPRFDFADSAKDQKATEDQGGAPAAAATELSDPTAGFLEELDQLGDLLAGAVDMAQ
eukprot:NODE_6588_length_555_cov_7.274704_g6168_i0.p2 GENE.NODE_6588_length_555_cov_7.274704_g6168_i0~~NODE_6588_length_555_cov_7.274704_g6168_i0.p2  ORF type:complete len:111 (+),score=24.29 NODE_6588_length_555_cov_7.274704_g6168_i0:126-458(+)